MKSWQVALTVAALTVPVYAGAVSNGWTFDDNLIVRRNEAAHSVPAAWKASLSPYWPVTDAGQYRPLAIMTYAVDWAMSRGNPAWFHGSNVALHAVACALLAVLLLRWLPPLGALAAGTVFAWHPVHVEAVANVVGRAELLAAIGLFAAVLAARRFRSAVAAGARWRWATATLIGVLVALLSKEHGVVAIVLIAADHALELRGGWRSSAALYVACAALTVAWLYAWWGIAGRLAPEVVAAPLSGLSFGERVATMLPVQLDVVRLLVWPSNLAADYNPLMIPRRHDVTWLALLGLITTGALLALAVAVARRAPAVTFGIVVAAVTYGPTSNLLFASGVPLAERNLYMAAAATAVVAGWLAASISDVRGRWVALAAVAGLAFVYAARSIARVPFWKDDQTAVIDEFVSHPENYRNHLRLATMFVDRGDTLSGLAQAMVGARLFPDDPWVPSRVVPWALDVGWDRIAREEAERAVRARPDEPAFHRLMTRVFLASGRPDSALEPARRAVVGAPNSKIVRQWYIEVLDSMDAPPWRTALAAAHVDWLDGRFASAGRHLDQAMNGLAVAGTVRDCWDVARAEDLIARLRPQLLDRPPAEESGPACGLQIGRRYP